MHSDVHVSCAVVNTFSSQAPGRNARLNRSEYRTALFVKLEDRLNRDSSFYPLLKAGPESIIILC